jgi:ATP synthase protein I
VEQQGQQPQYRGFGDGFAAAVELVVTPLLIALAGYGLDRMLGTGPIFLVLFATFGVVGVSVKTYYAYKNAMAREEEGKPWTTPRS